MQFINTYSEFSCLVYPGSARMAAFFLFWRLQYHQMKTMSPKHSDQQTRIVTIAGTYLGASLGRNV